MGHQMKIDDKQKTVGGTRGMRERIIYKRLLLIPYLAQDPVNVLDLNTKSVQEYTSLNRDFINSVTYMPVSRYLLLCAGRPHEILTWQLEQQKTTKLINAKADAMAVDETAKAIFFLTYQRDSKIYKMTTEGENKSVLFHKNDRPANMVVDTFKKQLYVSLVHTIVALDYTGSTSRKVAEGRSIYGLALDPTGDTLYFNRVVDIMTAATAKRRRSVNMVKRIKGIAKDLEYHKGNLYVGSTSGVYEIQNISGKTIATNIELDSLQRHLLCLVH